MHYPSNAFLPTDGSCTTPSIVTKSGAPIPHNLPSTGDIASVRALYGVWTNVRPP
jgi:hypothetical protein